jgi:5-methylcytosine-specific restriction enzyme subunit McrC
VTISLTEYGNAIQFSQDSIPVDSILKESQHWQQILGLNESPIVISYSGNKQVSLRASGVTGLLRVGSLDIEIRPKFLDNNQEHNEWKSALYNILTFINSSPLFTSDHLVVESKNDSFLDLMGSIFLNGIIHANEEGYPRKYNEFEEDLTVVRGRIDFRKINRLITHPWLIPCIYDDFNDDMPINRLLSWACHHLSSQVSSLHMARSLRENAPRVHHLHSLPLSISEADLIVLAPQFQYLQSSLDVARILLKQQSLQFEFGELKSSSFLWKSADVFERFVRHLLQLVCTLEDDWRLDKPRVLLATASPTTKIMTIPDYRIRENGKTILVLDAKYKILRQNSQPSTDNMYQIMASGRLLNCKKVCLIYPKYLENHNKTNIWRINDHNNPELINIMFIDLLKMISIEGKNQLISALYKDIKQILIL